MRPNVSVVKAPTIYLLGKKCKDEDEARMLMQEAIWFTYRTNFLVSERYHSDIGWGCLIRVGQMLLAASLLKYIRSQKL